MTVAAYWLKKLSWLGFLANMIFVFCSEAYSNELCSEILGAFKENPKMTSQEKVEKILEGLDGHANQLYLERQREKNEESKLEDLEGVPTHLSDLLLPKARAHNAHFGKFAVFWAFEALENSDLNIWNQLSPLERNLFIRKLSFRFAKANYNSDWDKGFDESFCLEHPKKCTEAKESKGIPIIKAAIGIPTLFIASFLPQSAKLLELGHRLSFLDELKKLNSKSKPTGISPLLYYRSSSNGQSVGCCRNSAMAMILVLRQLGASKDDAAMKIGFLLTAHAWVDYRPIKGLPFELQVDPTPRGLNLATQSRFKKFLYSWQNLSAEIYQAFVPLFSFGRIRPFSISSRSHDEDGTASAE